ncbi:MAG: hypothetical protein ACI9XK_005089, partial [Granulosicoccus sp.]
MNHGIMTTVLPRANNINTSGTRKDVQNLQNRWWP